MDESAARRACGVDRRDPTHIAHPAPAKRVPCRNARGSSELCRSGARARRGLRILYAFEPGTDGSRIPKRLDGVALVSATDASAVFAQLVALAPKLGAIGLAPDGALHEILAGVSPLPFPVFAGVGAYVMLVASGADARDRAESALADTAMQPVPFLVVDYDYAKFDELQRALGLSSASAAPALHQRLVRSFGRGKMTAALEDDSLAVWTTIELK